MRKAIISFVLVLPAFAALATSSGVNSLKLHSKSGHDVVISLNERPRVTFVGNDIVVDTHMGSVSYPSDDIVRFTYESIEPSAINDARICGMFISLSDDAASVVNLTPHESVSLYAVDGTLLYSATADNEGRVSLPLSGNANTIYLLKTSSVTLKICKP